VIKLIELADVIKLSESAAKQIAGDKEITEIIKEFLQNTEIVVITLGKEGCYIANEKEIIKCPSYEVRCIDGTGSGDAFMGGLSYAILKNMDLRDVGMFANACGAYCCKQIGARSSGTVNDIRGIFENSKNLF